MCSDGDRPGKLLDTFEVGNTNDSRTGLEMVSFFFLVKLHSCSHFFFRFFVDVCSVGEDVSVDYEDTVMASSISKCCVNSLFRTCS